MTSSLTTQGNGYSAAKTIMTEKLMNWSVPTLGANRQKNHAITNVFFSAFLIPVGIGCCSAKVLMQVAANCSLFINQNQILPDAEFWCSIEYLLHVNMVLLAVLTVCGSALLLWDETSFVFNVCAAFGSTVGKVANALRKIFHPFSNICWTLSTFLQWTE